MKLKNNIRGTLKKALFLSPNPPKDKKEYLILSDFIFPDKDLFISFLEEDDVERQISIAKDILLCLVYDSHFAPPTRLLFNILDMDSSDLNANFFDTFYRRDHFVHLVHTYILGVYIFFYHTAINEHITHLFLLKRSKKQIINESQIASAKKDAFIAWRYFVLYHDLAYPIENYLGNLICTNKKSKQSNGDNLTKEDAYNSLSKEEKYFKAFEKLSKSIGKDLVLKGLSKVIAIKNLILVHNEELFEYSVYNYLLKSKLMLASNKKREFEFAEIIKKDWISGTKISGIFGYSTLRSIVKIFKKEQILTVLFNNQNIPLIIYYPEKEGHTVYLTKYCRKNINEAFLSSDYPFNEHNDTLKSYILSYYYIDPQKEINNFLKYLFGNVSEKNYINAIDYLSNITKSKAELIVNENDFKKYCFEIFLSLYKASGYYNNYAEDGYYTGASAIDNLIKEIENLDKNIPDLISSSLKSLLKKELPEGRYFKQGMEKDKTAIQIIGNILNTVAPDYGTLKEKLSIPISQTVKSANILHTTINSMREEIGSKFMCMDIRKGLFIKKEENKVDFIKSDFYNQINSMLCKLKIGEYDLLLQGYRPEFSNKQRFFDHGLYGGLVMIEILNTYETILKQTSEDDNNFIRLRNLSMSTDINKWEEKRDYKIFDIMNEACLAVVIHNLYPEALNNKEYRTDLFSAPFAFWALLTDSLQPWDRRYSINQAYTILPYNTTSSKFNIEIIKNKIRITEINSGLVLNQRLNQLKYGLDKYLKHASDSIEVILGDVK